MPNHGPTPRWNRREDLSPFAKLLVEWMRYHGVVSMSELVPLFGLSQQAISAYFRPGDRAIFPAPATLQRISRATGIPLATLYIAAGVPTYDDVPPSVQPPAIPLPPAPSAWESYYREIADLPLPREMRERLINHAENVRLGRDPMRAHILMEFTIPADETSATPSPADKHALAPTKGKEED